MLWIMKHWWLWLIMLIIGIIVGFPLFLFGKLRLDADTYGWEAGWGSIVCTIVGLFMMLSVSVNWVLLVLSVIVWIVLQLKG